MATLTSTQVDQERQQIDQHLSTTFPEMSKADRDIWIDYKIKSTYEPAPDGGYERKMPEVDHSEDGDSYDLNKTEPDTDIPHDSGPPSPDVLDDARQHGLDWDPEHNTWTTKEPDSPWDPEPGPEEGTEEPTSDPGASGSDQDPDDGCKTCTKEPGFWESMIPIWGSGRSFLAHASQAWHDGFSWKGAFEATLAAVDAVFFVGDVLLVGALAKAAFKLAAKAGETIVEVAVAQQIKEAETAAEKKAEQALETAGKNVLEKLPKNPEELLQQGYKETSHPGAAKAGHRTFENPETGDKIRFDRGNPDAPPKSHEAHDHYHRENPNATGKRDAYLDADGKPCARGSEESHLYPEEK